jgi:hypothetical protein
MLRRRAVSHALRRSIVKCDRTTQQSGEWQWMVVSMEWRTYVDYNTCGQASIS